VLALAEDPSQRLLERAKYLAIVSTNLDEFFQVRVAGLRAQFDAGVTAPASDGRTPREQLTEIRMQVLEQLRVQEGILHKEVLPALAERGIRMAAWAELDEIERARLQRVFEEQILPVLTPQAVDRAHPFPYVSNLSLNLAVVVRDASTGEPLRARKVPGLLPASTRCPTVRFPRSSS
jgi:polyphosphate kinase